MEFIHELGLQPGQEHIALACELAKTDGSLDVRLACLGLLNDAGASETCAEIVGAPEFEQWAKGLSNELLPRLPKRCLRPFVPRLKAALADMQSFSGRNAIVGVLHALDDPDWPNLVKTEMDRILKTEGVAFRPTNDWHGTTTQKPELPNAAPVLARYLEAIHRVAPDWAMDWLGYQLVQGQFWWEPFTDYLAKMPEPILRRVATAGLDAGLGVNTTWRHADLLGRSGSHIAAKAMLDECLAWKAQGETRQIAADSNRGDALKSGLHEVPLPVFVDVVIREAGSIDDFRRLRDLVGLIMPTSALDSALRLQLTQGQKDSLRSLAFRLEEMKPAELSDVRWFRAHQAVLVGTVGKPEDAQILETWIQDEIRYRAEEDAEWKAKYQAWEAGGRKAGRPGGRGIIVHWNWYQGALVQLACPESGEVFLRLLRSPELLGDAAWGLVLLTRNNNEASSLFADHPQYSQIYERRREGRAKAVNETSRRFADAIFEVIQNLMTEFDKANFPKREIVRAASALAALDDMRAMPLLLKLSSDKYSGWDIAEALHGLVGRGVVVSGKAASEALEPFIAEHEQTARGGEHDNWYEVVRCLAVLLFSDTPSIGVERIRRLPTERLKSYHVLEIARLLGVCRAPEAADLLIELARVPEIHCQCSYDLVAALSENVNPQARRCLLDLLDQLCSGELPRGHDTVDPLAKALAGAATADEAIWADIKSRCKRAGSPVERDLLSRILQEIGNDDAAFVLCDLIHDEYPLTYQMERLIEAVVTTHEPAGGSSYYIRPRGASAIRKRLLGIAMSDVSRRTSALELLAAIAQSRLEHGTPVNEPVHADIDTLRQNPVPWQLLA